MSKKIFLFVVVTLFTFYIKGQTYQLIKTIKGDISPKSVVHNHNGLFFAQNMMYKHKITVYNRNKELVKTISDKIHPSQCDNSPSKPLQGSPVEAASTSNGKFMWVSNYQMYGEGYDNPGVDACKISNKYDKSYVYKINTVSFDIDQIIQVGCIPKYLASTTDNKLLLVSNWCSGDVSIVDQVYNKEIARVPIGRYPRGIAIDSKNKYAYVTEMGGWDLVKIDLQDSSFSSERIKNIGKRPRHICISPDDNYLYITINSEGKIAKYNLKTQKLEKKISTGSTPRSMVMSQDGKMLFVVNYNSNTFSVVRTSDMKVLNSYATNHHPIGITYDNAKDEVWVACYSGSIMVYKGHGQRDEKEKIVVEENNKENEPIEDTPKPSVSKEKNKSNSNNYKYHIIVGAFGEKQNAENMLKKCRSLGYNPYIVNPNAKILKISCAGFSEISTARRALDKAKTDFGSGSWLLIY